MASHYQIIREAFLVHAYRQPTGSNSQIQYITIATTGNAAEFGSSPPSLSNENGAGVGDSNKGSFLWWIYWSQ